MVKVESWGFEPQSPTCHAGVLPLDDDPESRRKKNDCWSAGADDPDSCQLCENLLPARTRIEELPGLRLFNDQDDMRPSSSRKR